MNLLTFCTTLTMLNSVVLAENPLSMEGFTYQQTVGGIMEYRLESNGLTVLLLPEKSAPVATFMVTYHVGSRNEVNGTTGATHLLEHLMFKGTHVHDRSLGTGFDQVLERVGAETNATTWLDRTNYFATVPANALQLLIEIEADRMRNLALREDDRRPEMTVVRNEFELGENHPTEALSKEIWASAFLAHPYHHDTIGWRSDIERVPIEKLRAFYDTYYWPNNATVTVIGDFDPTDALNAIKKHYGAIPKAPNPIPEIYTEEPAQTGQRRVKVQSGGELGLVALAHKIPDARHPDWPAIEVLSAILTAGKTSRCYRALTDKNLTTEIVGSAGFHRDPSLHIMDAEVMQGVKHETVEKKLVAEIEKVKTEGVTTSEIQTAVAGLLAKQAFARDGTFELASEINECIAVGDWTLFVSLDDKLKAVTAEEVQRVAKKYFIEKHSVAGWFVPTGAGEAEEAEPTSTQQNSTPFPPKKVLPAKAPQKELLATKPTHFAERIIRDQVEGMDVLACRTGVKNIVHLHGSLPAGEGYSANRALAHLTAGLLEQGTVKHDQFAIADLLEKVGATIDFKVHSETLEFSAKCLSTDLPLVVSLLAEQLRTPAFASTELTKVKKRLASEIQQTLEDPDAQAAVAFSRAVFPVDHPSHNATAPELVAGIEKAKLTDIRAFHTAHYGPNGLHLVAVGDVHPATFKAEVVKAFGGWKPQSVSVVTPSAAAPTAANECLVPMPDKSSISVIFGQTSGVSSTDPDWLALRIATEVLGHGFTSRLVGNVRDREGLTYHISSSLEDDTFRAGTWQVAGSFAPTMLNQGIASTLREIHSWWQDGLNADELAYRKSAAVGQFAVSLETTEGLAKQILRCAERGVEMKWLDDFPAKINALTLEETNAAVKKHLDPAKLVTVKAGTLK